MLTKKRVSYKVFDESQVNLENDETDFVFLFFFKKISLKFHKLGFTQDGQKLLGVVLDSWPFLTGKLK